MAVVEIFKALGDPIRLEMIQRLSSGSSYTITSVSSQLGISRQGARKHLDILEHANLVILTPEGRDVHVQLEPASLENAKACITQWEEQWDKRLGALKKFIENS